MTTTKHTPGPWEIAEVDHAYAHIRGDNLIDGHAGILAKVLLTGNDFSQANARLIAASPDLLEALIAIESCLRPEDNDYAAQKVRAAIAKATGQST